MRDANDDFAKGNYFAMLFADGDCKGWKIIEILNLS